MKPPAFSFLFSRLQKQASVEKNATRSFHFICTGNA